MKADGGPVFPTTNNCQQYGMSLRDLFVAAAIASGICPYGPEEHVESARWAGDRADAMITERRKHER